MPTQENTDGTALLVDIGNTNLKWCWLKNGERSKTFYAAHRERPGCELLDQNWRGPEVVSQVLIANVSAPQLNEEVAAWVVKRWGCPVHVLKSEKLFAGVTNAYRDPQQLGVDRWLTLLAAHREYPGDNCIVDCGTAITIDLLLGGGEHQGGLILPGFTLMRSALLDKTHIPRVDRDPEMIPVLARDTQSAVASASLYAAVALVEYILNYARAQVGSVPRLLLTGSDAERLRSGLSAGAIQDTELIMKGLTIYAEELLS